MGIILLAGLQKILRIELGIGSSLTWLVALVGIALAVIAATVFIQSLRPLQSFLAIFIASSIGAFAVHQGAIPTLISSVVAGFPMASEAVHQVSRLLRMGIGFTVFLALGYRREDAFLAVGDLSATFHPGRLPGFQFESDWTVVGTAGAVIGITVVTFFLSPLWGICRDIS